MSEPRTLNYRTPAPKRPVGPPPFWGPLLGCCVVGFVLTSLVLSSLFGVGIGDGGVWFLEAFGIVVTLGVVAFSKRLAPRGTRFPTWLAITLGLVAPSAGLIIYSLSPWG